MESDLVTDTHLPFCFSHFSGFQYIILDTNGRADAAQRDVLARLARGRAMRASLKMLLALALLVSQPALSQSRSPGYTEAAQAFQSLGLADRIMTMNIALDYVKSCHYCS
jgi:hypothetical protein